MLPAVINFKLELLLPVVRSSDAQEEGEDEEEIHSLGICYCLWPLSVDWTGSNAWDNHERFKKQNQTNNQPTNKTVGMFLNGHKLINS